MIVERTREGGDGTGWIDCKLAQILLRRKHTLPILLVLYDRGAVDTSDLILCVHGHPGSVIRTLRILERSGVLNRVRRDHGHHPVETRLTLRGMQLVETPVYLWRELFRKWNRMDASSGSASPGGETS